MKKQLAFVSAALALAASQPVSAATTWTLGPTDPPGILTTIGVANTNGSLIEVQPDITNTVWYTGGWGINNLDGCSSGSTCDVGDLQNTAPEHAIDNNQRYEMLLIGFNTPTKLTQMDIGYSNTDSDMTVLAYTSNTPFALNTNLVGKTYSQLTTSGWTVIGDYANVPLNTQQDINTAGGGVVSSYWLIGAYNPLGGTASLTDGNDYVKLFSVTGTGGNTTKSVPEPTSLALVAAGLIGALRVRRRSRTRQ
jgi:PEP-CTERM motif-containing protein